jgi:UDP-N-acetylmuramoylalanine-D-glutamate ligase
MYDWSKMSVGILGAGIENIALIQYLLKQGAKVILYDQNYPRLVAEKVKDLEDPNLMIVAGKDYRRKLSNHDIFFRSPGMPLKLAKRLTRGKGQLSSPMQIFF